MEAQQTQQQPKQVALADVEIKDENIALNVMVAMLNMAQKRGTFTMEESSKCWECIQKFSRPQQNAPQNEPQNEPQNSPQNVNMETTEKYENDGSGVF
jgi:hypothetical protein